MPSHLGVSFRAKSIEAMEIQKNKHGDEDKIQKENQNHQVTKILSKGNNPEYV
jgi:hypothetical protein